jgi:hypothetical protein
MAGTSDSSGEIPWDELAAPARRALTGAGITRLEDLTRVSEGQLKRLHGIGSRALETLKNSLQAQGLAFANDG